MTRLFKRNLVLPVFLLLSTLIIASCSSSRKVIPLEEGWDLIGETKVNFVKDNEVVTVYNTNKYTAIRFKVEKKAISLKDIKIVFQNGDKLVPTLEDKIAADQYSRVIELGPEGKSVRSVDFKFRSTGNLLRGRANVLVFGKRYTPGY